MTPGPLQPPFNRRAFYESVHLESHSSTTLQNSDGVNHAYALYACVSSK